MALVPHEIISNSLVTPKPTRDTAVAGNMVYRKNLQDYFISKILDGLYPK